jgi:RNA polymerase sigma-70 factor (ECF subfamily)
VDTTLTRAALRSPSEKRTAEEVSAERFDELIREHQHAVYRLLCLLLKDGDDAATLSQECFLRAYQNFSGFRGDCTMRTWLFRIAVNLARDHHKNRRAGFWKRLVGLDDLESDGDAREGLTAQLASPERIVLAREKLEEVWRVLDGLSPQQRAVFLLRFSEDMALSDIALVLKVKVGSVKKQLFRALAAVRGQMKEQSWK